jgi:hypothetical protein
MSKQTTAQSNERQQQATRDAATEGAIEARVTRYNLSRLRIGQALVPFAAIANVLARRLPGAVTWTIGGVLIVGALVAFLSAAKHLGLQRSRFEHGALVFGDSGVKASTAAFRRWTYDAGIARLYGSAFSFRLHAKQGCGDAMRLALSHGLGAPLELTRRGSPRARALALCVTIFGAISSGFGLAHSATLIVIGVPCFLFGAGALGALSQKVVRG